MVQPEQRVIVYQHGLRKKTMREYREEGNQRDREALGYPICSGCGKRYKDPDRAHYKDFKNKIRCL